MQGGEGRGELSKCSCELLWCWVGPGHSDGPGSGVGSSSCLTLLSGFRRGTPRARGKLGLDHSCTQQFLLCFRLCEESFPEVDTYRDERSQEQQHPDTQEHCLEAYEQGL